MPGCVDGWMELHGRFGRMPLARVLEPATAYADRGFPASRLTPGTPVRRPGVAAALDAIASGGRDAFYLGPFGAGPVELGGGVFAPEDLARPQADWVTPLHVTAWGHDVWTDPAALAGVPHTRRRLDLGRPAPARRQGAARPAGNCGRPRRGERGRRRGHRCASRSRSATRRHPDGPEHARRERRRSHPPHRANQPAHRYFAAPPTPAYPFPQLTAREVEILQLMAEHLTNPEIAARFRPDTEDSPQQRVQHLHQTAGRGPNTSHHRRPRSRAELTRINAGNVKHQAEMRTSADPSIYRLGARAPVDNLCRRHYAEDRMSRCSGAIRIGEQRLIGRV